MSSSKVRLIVFAKLPRLGEVKTRLQSLLGAESCLALHYCLIDHALELAGLWEFGPVELWFSEQSSNADMERLVLEQLEVPQSATLHYQSGSNLGERMQYALQRAVDQGDSAVLIGTDCPTQSFDHLLQAVSLLQADKDVVLQPACDGGFVLIASSNKAPDLSGDIDWGTSKVLAQLQTELEKQSLSIGIMETISDLDDEKDFVLLQQDDSSFLSKFYTKQLALKKS